MVDKLKSKSQTIREYITANPNASIADVAKATNATYTLVYDVKKRMSTVKAPKKRGRPAKKIDLTPALKFLEGRALKGAQPWDTLSVTSSDQSIKSDPVNQPAHYKVGGVETIDFIEAKKLNYNLGNVVKYVTRADHKSNTYEDLCKARWYLNREITKHTGVANQ
jgi:hypothetical protein